MHVLPQESRIVVPARARFTPVRTVATGDSLRLIADGSWRDGFVRRDAAGFESRWLLRPFERFRILPSARWCALGGVIGPQGASPSELRRLARQQGIDLSAAADHILGWTADRNGMFYVFANDVPWAYWNNSGSIVLRVHAADRPPPAGLPTPNDGDAPFFPEKRGAGSGDHPRPQIPLLDG